MRIPILMNFLCFILLVISSVNSQKQSVKVLPKLITRSPTSPKNGSRLYDKNGNLYDFISSLKVIPKKGQVLTMLIKEMATVLKELKNENNRTRVKLEQEVTNIKAHNLDLEQMKMEKNSMKKEINALRVKLEQEVSDSKAHEKECARREEAIKNEVNEGQSEMMRRVGALEKTVSLTIPHVHLSSSDEYYKKKPDFIWNINNLRNKVKHTNFELLSEVFPLKGYSFGAQAKLTLEKNGYLEIRLAYKDVNESGTALNLKLIPQVHCTYEDRSSKNRIRESNYLFTAVLQYDVFYYNQWIIPSNNITDNNAYIEIHVEPPEAVQQGYSYNGILTWAIDHFRSKREMTEQKLVWRQRSPYFYTGPKGYRVQARMRLNGYLEYKGKGLTVEIDFLTGPYDADLSRSFKHQTTVTLFHPTDPTKVIVKSVEWDLKEGVKYMINMGTHAEVENVLDGDTLYYQVKIFPS